MFLAALVSLTMMVSGGPPPLSIDMPPPNPGSPNLCKPTVFDVRTDGSIWRGKTQIERTRFVSTVLADLKANDCGERVYLRPDPATPFSEVLGLMRMLRAGGVGAVGLIESEEGQSAPAPFP